jgi:Ca2+-binding EF-hand superfamily protein
MPPRSRPSLTAPRLPPFMPSSPEAIRKAFTSFDADNSGSIDAKELKQALKHLGIEVNGPQ